jgi:phage shock protein A
MGIFRAIGRFFRTIGYLLTGRINISSDALSSNSAVIGATYDKVVTDKRNRLNQYKNAVGGLIANQETKIEKLKGLGAEVEKLEKLKAGALAKGQQVAKSLDNDPEKVKVNPDYLKCTAAYRDFTSTLAEKNKRIAELESDLKTLSGSIADHKVQIDGLLRDLENVKSEKNETLAEVIGAQEQQKINDMFSGLSEDKTSQDLERMREMRTKAKASARMSSELAGMNNAKNENEFLAFAETAQADTEFDKLIGLTKESEPTAPVSEPTKISEN